MIDKAVALTVSVYQSQVDKVRTFVKHSTKFKTEASFFQYMIDDFFNKKTGVKDFMLYLGYPMIFAGIMLYVAITTQNVNETLLRHDIISDLFIYNQIYFVIGFAFIGIIIAGFALIWSKIKEGK